MLAYRTTPSPLCFELNSHNGILGVGDSMGVVRMYAPNSGTSVTSILCHKGGLTSMAYSRDGFSLITNGSEGTIKIWDLRT
jgi:WD40 repeat protein